MTKLIIANWKSHKSIKESEQWLIDFKHALQNYQKPDDVKTELQVIVAAPFTALTLVAESVTKDRVGVPLAVGVQDISPFPAGKYTGAVSVQNLLDVQVEYAIVGHSERRHYFAETDQDVARKVDQALQAGITPVVCVDENYVMSQAAAIESSQLGRCVVAYEPLAAIGTGNNADVGTVARVKNMIAQAFGTVPVLYGGSVDEKNVNEYMLVSDGVLVGGASLDAVQFAALVEKALV